MEGGFIIGIQPDSPGYTLPIASTTGVPVLYNPIGNTMNLVLNKIGIANLVALAASSLLASFSWEEVAV
jgi:hypothetical protein